VPDSTSQICPQCGTPFAGGAVFCDACGADLHAASSAPALGGAGRTEAEDVGPAESAVRKSRAEFVPSTELSATAGGAAEPGGTQGGSLRPSMPAQPAFFPSPLHADPSDAVPFVLEWDVARQFIEGQSGAFAFRVTALWDLAKIGVAASVDGEDLPCAVFSGMRRGETREGTFAFTPGKTGRISVRLRVETVPRGLAHEMFAASGDPEHMVFPARRISVQGAGVVTINVENNTGIVRNDELDLRGLRGTAVDHWEDQRRALGLGGEFRSVAFSPGSVRRENALLRSSAADGLSELLVLPGTDLVTFGTSSRADAGLFVETEDGYTDERRTGYVSGLHFSIQRDPKREAFILRDGGPDRKTGSRSAWKKSTNGILVDGEDLRGEHPLRPGAILRVCLAPYAVSGGALPLEIETKGWDDPAADGCEDRPGNLSSLLVRRRDNPRKAILVVWGAAALDPVLGTATGLRVACAVGRLFLVQPDGGGTRFHRLAGHFLPGTPFTIS